MGGGVGWGWVVVGWEREGGGRGGGGRGRYRGVGRVGGGGVRVQRGGEGKKCVGVVLGWVVIFYGSGMGVGEDCMGTLQGRREGRRRRPCNNNRGIFHALYAAGEVEL